MPHHSCAMQRLGSDDTEIKIKNLRSPAFTSTDPGATSRHSNAVTLALAMSPSPMNATGRFRLRDLLPFGPGRHPRPRPFVEMAQVVWENRDNLPRLARPDPRRECDGCAPDRAGCAMT